MEVSSTTTATRCRQPECAIVCLTRGYADIQGYNGLINRNRSVYETINRHREIQYPLIIWHEGNISPAHQEHVLAHESNADVRFINVSDAFQLPPESDPRELMESWSPGYRLMCRFHTYYIWQRTQQFAAVMRIDEDCTLKHLAFDRIRWLLENGLDFATSAFMAEPHELTNRTLAPFVERYAAGVVPPLKNLNPYNQSFPYTNLYVTRTAFWRDPEMQRFLTAVVRETGFIRLRWGDAPVLGLALNMFDESHKVAIIPGLVYEHASHAVTISTVPASSSGNSSDSL